MKPARQTGNMAVTHVPKCVSNKTRSPEDVSQTGVPMMMMDDVCCSVALSSKAKNVVHHHGNVGGMSVQANDATTRRRVPRSAAR